MTPEDEREREKTFTCKSLFFKFSIRKIFSLVRKTQMFISFNVLFFVCVHVRFSFQKPHGNLPFSEGKLEKRKKRFLASPFPRWRAFWVSSYEILHNFYLC